MDFSGMPRVNSRRKRPVKPKMSSQKTDRAEQLNRGAENMLHVRMRDLHRRESTTISQMNAQQSMFITRKASLLQRRSSIKPEANSVPVTPTFDDNFTSMQAAASSSLRFSAVPSLRRSSSLAIIPSRLPSLTPQNHAAQLATTSTNGQLRTSISSPGIFKSKFSFAASSAVIHEDKAVSPANDTNNNKSALKRSKSFKDPKVSFSVGSLPSSPSDSAPATPPAEAVKSKPLARSMSLPQQKFSLMLTTTSDGKQRKVSIPDSPNRRSLARLRQLNESAIVSERVSDFLRSQNEYPSVPREVAMVDDSVRYSQMSPRRNSKPAMEAVV